MQIPGFEGQLISSGDDGYDQARQIWNGAIDRKPSLIARCGEVSDVVAAIRYARDRDLLVAVRGGGHGVAGSAVCDDGLVIDLSTMKAIEFDRTAGTVRAQGGVLWGELDALTQRAGLATTGGVVSHTGIAGLTLGGGIGWLMRKHGLAVDNLISCEVVTADGSLVTTSETENPDLFWALRGGGGNFGIVTSFQYQLHPVGPDVLCGPVLWSMDQTPAVLGAYAELAPRLPREAATIFTVRKAPALPSLPERLHGEPVCILSMAYFGDPQRGESTLRPLRAISNPVHDGVAIRPYLTLQSMLDATAPHGWHYYWKSAETASLTPGLIDVIVEHANRIESPLTYAVMFQLGGALAEVDEEAMAYSNRGAAHNININGIWREEEPIAERETAWTRKFFNDLQPHQTGVYVNFLGDEGQDRVRAAYDERKYRRLVAIKDKWDPDNVLRLNQNIPPSRATS